jgi:hypothetical protein
MDSILCIATTTVKEGLFLAFARYGGRGVSVSRDSRSLTVTALCGNYCGNRAATVKERLFLAFARYGGRGVSVSRGPGNYCGTRGWL